MRRPLIACLIFMHGAAQDTARVPPVPDDRFPLEISGEVREDVDGFALIDALDWIRLHPYDLNRISRAEILSIPCVTPGEADAILEYREMSGRFNAPGDLLTIPGGSESLYRALAPYVCIRPGSDSGGRSASMRVRAARQSPAAAGSPGSPLKFLSRLVLGEYEGVEAGSLFAKGGGERTEDSFLSAYARVTNVGCVREILAGDFEIESGEGLVFWRGPVAAGNLWSVRPGDGLRVVPNRSSDETRFLRGLAIVFSTSERWSGALFFSDRSYGASVDSTGEATGFFRGEYATVTSLAKRDALRERLAGFHAGFTSSGACSAGCAVYTAVFDRRFAPVDRMRLSGDRVIAGSLDMSARLGALSTAGEYAFTGGGSCALLLALTLASPRNGMLMIRWRDYQPGYDNPHASGEGENGETRNERGVSAGLHVHPARGITISCLVDAFEHPWPTLIDPMPRRGTSLTVNGDALLPRGGKLSVRYSRKRSYDPATATDAWGREVKVAGETCDDRFRCEVSGKGGDLAGFSARAEYASVAQPAGGVVHGVILGGDVTLSIIPHLSLDARLSLFRTDGYAARLYDFEQALPGLASVPPLYGHGARWYARFRWSVPPWGEIALRYARTLKETSVSAAGPLIEIPGDTAGEIGVQADILVP